MTEDLEDGWWLESDEETDEQETESEEKETEEQSSIYRMVEPPFSMPAQDYMLKYLETGKQEYFQWYLHALEPMLNQKAHAVEQNYAMYGFFPDLKQACVEGLLAAAQKYEPEQGTTFWWYASQYEIPKAVHDYIRQARPGFTVESASEYKTLRSIMWQYGELQIKGAEDPISVIAEKTGLSAKTVQSYVQSGMRNRAVLPLDQDEEDERTYIPTPDYAADPARVYLRKCRHEILFTAFSKLTFKEKDVVSRHLGFCSKCLSTKDKDGDQLPEEFFEDIAVLYGVTPKEIGKIYTKAIKKLQKNTEELNYYQSEDQQNCDELI